MEIDRLDIAITANVKQAMSQVKQLSAELEKLKVGLQNVIPSASNISKSSTGVSNQTRRIISEYKKAAKTITDIRDKMYSKSVSVPDTASGARKALDDYKKMYANARDKVLNAQGHGENSGKVYRNQVEQMYKAAQGIKAARQVLNDKIAKDEAYQQLIEQERAAKAAARSVEQLATAYDDVAQSAKAYIPKYENKALVDQYKKNNMHVGASPYIKSGRLNFEDEKASYSSLKDTMASVSASIQSTVQVIKSSIGAAFESMKTKVEGFKVSLRERAVASGILSYTQDFVTLQKAIEKTRADYAKLTEQMAKHEQFGTTNTAAYQGLKARKPELEAELKNSMDYMQRMKLDGSAYEIDTRTAQQSLNNLKAAFQRVGVMAKQASKAVGAFLLKVSGIKGATNKTKSAMIDVTGITKKLVKELTRVSRMFKMMLTRMSLRAVISNVGDGFKSLALHSETFNNSMSSLINSTKTLGYSISSMVSPLINALAPALVYVINLITQAVNAINQLFSALTGAGTWNRAKNFTDSWKDSIKGASGAAKDLKKTVMGFDELNQLQDNASSGGGGADGIKDMFDTVKVDSGIKEVADKIKELAKTLFDPIKQAWQNVGEFVKSSWAYAMREVGKLIKDVARDFLKVWQQADTRKIFENIFETVGWIGVAVGNLAKQFREAWNFNETGLHILENIRDVILIITTGIKDMAKVTAEWAATLDFKPLLTSIKDYIASLKPVFAAIMGTIGDFYREVVLKFTKWVIESGLPELINVFKRFNEKVDWEGLRAKLAELWKHLEPFMEKVGEGLIIFIERVTDAIADFINSDTFENFLKDLGEWMDSVKPEDVADGIETLVKALVVFKATAIAISGLSGVITVIKGVGAAIQGTAAIAGSVGGVIKTATAKIGEMAASIAPALKTATGAIGSWMTADVGATLAGGGAAAGGMAASALVASIAAFLGGSEIGKKVGEWIFPDDKELYEKYEGVKGTFALYGDFFRTLGEEIAEHVGKAWDNVKEATRTLAERTGEHCANAKLAIVGFADGVKAKGEEIKTNIGEVRNSLAEKVDGIKTKFAELKDTTQEKITAFNNTIAEKVEGVKGKFESLNQTISDKKASIVSSFADMDAKAKEKLESIKGKLGEFSGVWAQKWADAKAKIDEFKTNVATALDNIKSEFSTFKDKIAEAFSKDNWTFSGVMEGLKKTFTDAKDAIAGIWNSFADKINGEIDIGSTKFNINIPKVYAAGGFPEDGLFWANHNELVGRFSNGRTAVANNEQITNGIRYAVKDAMMEAMGGLANTINGRPIVVESVIDGEVAARAITKAQDKMYRRYNPQTF